MKTILSYILYYLGHYISKPVQWWNWGFLYPVYTKLMCWSFDLDTKKKVWRPLKNKKWERRVKTKTNE